jgi:hypothetical protein
MLQQNDLMLIEEQEQKTIFHATCLRCQTATMVIVSGNQTGIVSIGIATDLDREEVKSKFFGNNINADEVIDVHELILNHNKRLVDLAKSI